MVSKVSSEGRPYDIDGRAFIWHPEDDEGDQGTVEAVRIPLRIKLKTVLAVGAEGSYNNESMMALLMSVVGDKYGDVVGEMDVNDFQDMFVTWMSEYNTLTGGSLGESSASPKSSASTEAPSSTTSEPASTAV